MKLILVIPETNFLDDGNFVSPLGLLYVAAALEDSFEDIKILKWKDFEAISMSLTDNYVVGLGGVSAHEKYFEILPQITPKHVIKLAGGPLPTVSPKKIKKYGFNIVVRGEIEGIKNEVLKAIRERSDKILLGHPNFDIDKYEPNFSLVSNYYNFHERIGIMTSRGCIQNCSFCAKIIKKLRFHNINYIVKQIKKVKQEYNPDLFIFYDDNILANHQRFVALASAIKDLNIKWRSQARADDVSIDIIRIAKESGCCQLSFGIESGSQAILDTVNKNINVLSNTKAIQICKKEGLKTKAFIMLGLPGESYKTVRETHSWVINNCPDIVSLYIFYPFKGCDIYSNHKQYDIRFSKIGPNYYASKDNYSPCYVQTSSLGSKYILALRNKLRRDFEKCGIKVY